MKSTENIYNLEKGTEFIFVPTGVKFKIEKVTDKNVSWYVGFEYKGGMGKNTLKMATQSLKRTNEGIAKGTYILMRLPK